MQQRLWPDTFVSDVSLTTLIFELRTALGDVPVEAVALLDEAVERERVRAFELRLAPVAMRKGFGLRCQESGSTSSSR